MFEREKRYERFACKPLCRRGIEDRPSSLIREDQTTSSSPEAAHDKTLLPSSVRLQDQTAMGKTWKSLLDFSKHVLAFNRTANLRKEVSSYARCVPNAPIQPHTHTRNHPHDRPTARSVPTRPNRGPRMARPRPAHGAYMARTWPVQCPYSARTVPVQCPYSARYSARCENTVFLTNRLD